jgi:hypothetical protein
LPVQNPGAGRNAVATVRVPGCFGLKSEPAAVSPSEHADRGRAAAASTPVIRARERMSPGSRAGCGRASSGSEDREHHDHEHAQGIAWEDEMEVNRRTQRRTCAGGVSTRAATLRVMQHTAAT